MSKTKTVAPPAVETKDAQEFLENPEVQRWAIAIALQIREAFSRNWFKIEDLMKQVEDESTPFEKLHFPVLMAYDLLKKHKTSGKYKVIVGTLDKALAKIEESPEFKEWESSSEEQKEKMAEDKKEELLELTAEENGGQTQVIGSVPNIEYVDEKKPSLIKSPEEFAGDERVEQVKELVKRNRNTKKK